MHFVSQQTKLRKKREYLPVNAFDESYQSDNKLPVRQFRCRFWTKVFLVVFSLSSFLYFTYHFLSKPTLKSKEYRYIVKDIPSNTSLHKYLKEITSKRHLAGTKEGKALAEWVNTQFKKFGFKSEIVEYFPYLNYPKKIRLAIVDPPEERWEASLQEPEIEQDSSTHIVQDIESPFFGYSASGNVTSEVVYANFGRLEDFESLEKNGISVKDKIVIVRYGAIFRGIKVMAAEKYGALGVIVYSDPIDDGFIKGKTYPDGPFRPEFGVQRGSSRYSSLGSGDALTPGIAATKDAPRLNISDAKTLPKIPSIPLSYGNVKYLLKSLKGHGSIVSSIGKDWEGGIDEEYWTGPSMAKVNLVNLLDGGLYPIYNVIATIEGGLEKNREVIFGNHRDAWVLGAVDPGSGSAVLLETARVLSELQRVGWVPRRTIKLCSWDAEEYGAIGSTEWVEDNLEELKKKAVAYINLDNFEGDMFVVDGPPSLLHFVRQSAKEVQDPIKKDSTIYDTWASRFKEYGGEPLMRGLGAGSDFTPFYHHVGIPSLSIKYRQKSGIYHSAYDTIKYMESYGDPQLSCHVALSQLISNMILQLSDSVVLPFNISQYGTDFIFYSEDEQKKLSKEALSKGVSLARLKEEAKRLESTAHIYMSKIAQLQNHPYSEDNINSINDKLAFFEKNFLNSRGISGREWFKHQLFAPGLWSGYGTQVFPALWEALDAKRWDDALEIIHDYEVLFFNASLSIYNA